MHTNMQELPGVSEVATPQGFHLRPATEDDVPDIVACFNAIDKQLTGMEMHRIESFARDWSDPKFDVAHSTRVAIESDTGRLAGYVSVWDTEPLPVSNWVSVCVHPEFEGLGLGTALHQWATLRLQETLDRVPADLKVTYHCGALRQHESALTLFDALGMERVRYFWRMMIEHAPETLIPVPVLPEGVVIRPWAEVRDQVSLRDVAAATEEAFRDHWGHVDQPLDEIMSDWQHWLDSTPAEEMGPDVWFLALDERTGEIAGVSLCKRRSRNNPEWAYLDALGVRRNWRKQGLALALLHYTFRFFQQAGFARTELHVDASSLTGATRLYEKAGMRVDEESVGYIQVLRHGRDLSVQNLEQ